MTLIYGNGASKSALWRKSGKRWRNRGRRSRIMLEQKDIGTLIHTDVQLAVGTSLEPEWRTIAIIAVSAELTIKDAIEIFAHELAHVASGEDAGHGEKWEQEFEKIFQEYHRIGREIFHD